MISELLEYIAILEINLNNDLESVEEDITKELIQKLIKTAHEFKEAIIICHVCKEEIEIYNNMASKSEEPICSDCDYKIMHQDDFSSNDDLMCYQEYGWKYEK